MIVIAGDFAPTQDPLPDADRVLAYLEQARPLLITWTLHEDRLDPTGWVRGHGTVTDGLVAWSVTVAHYVRKHRLAPPQDLLDHIRARDYEFPAAVSDAAILAAIEALQPTTA